MRDVLAGRLLIWVAASTAIGCAPTRPAVTPEPVTAKAAARTIADPAEPALEIRRTYALFETSFRLPGITGNPFAAEVWARVDSPTGHHFWRPAFYDGDGIWRLRITPVELGRHRFELFVGSPRQRVPAQATDLAATQFDVSGTAESGFVRRSSTRVQAFVLDDTTPFYPLGHDVAWATPEEYERIFAKMGDAGENWSRVWMSHWSKQNLDWNPDHRVELGTLDLEVARGWDRIVRAAEAHHVRFQLVLQHHGQYSTTTNPNWGDNPYARHNGGFLDRAEDFFTDARARELTERKLRYVVARWGYSTAIMAWELFNEVEWTDTYKNAHTDAIAAWHREMAAYLRSIDAYRHLITTSSVPTDSPIYKTLDYFQPHRYSSNVVDALRRYRVRTTELDRPIFYGEMGDESVLPGVPIDPRTVRAAIWAGLMADGAGAAQYWYWQPVDRGDLYASFGAAARFAAAAGFASQAMTSWPVETHGETWPRLVLSPASTWTKNDRTRFDLSDDGRPIDDIDRMPVYLHGDAAKVKDGLSHEVRFQLAPKRVVSLRIHVDEIAKAGAALEIRVDDRVTAKKSWPAAEHDQRVQDTVVSPIPDGQHAVSITGTGADWVHITAYEFDGYPQPVLRALSRISDTRDRLAVWVYSTAALADPDSKPTRGTLSVAGVSPGTYEVSWWDSVSGKPGPITQVTVPANGVLTLPTPSIAFDAAAIVTRTP